MSSELEEELMQTEELARLANLPTLKEKLSRVAAHCAYVQKGGVNEFHGYHYATAAAVFEKVGQALTEQRLTSVPVFYIRDTRERINAKGRSELLVTAQCILAVHDLDSSELVETTAYGSGQDIGDKAVMKAQTAALKYAWMMLLNISTGDDPEADATVDSRASGEPVRERQTPEEYLTKVDRNKAAKLSPLGERALALADGTDLTGPLKASIAMVRAQKEAEESGDEVCKCGAPLVLLTTSKAKGQRPYVVCVLRDKAFRKDEWAIDRMAELDKVGACGEKEHTWRWAM